MTDKPDGKHVFLKWIAIAFAAAGMVASPVIFFIPVLVFGPNERSSIVMVGGMIVLAALSTFGLFAISFALLKAVNRDP